MTERTLSRLPLLDLAMKGGALGVAIVGCAVLCYGVNKLYEDNRQMNATLIALVREQNGGLVQVAASQRALTEVMERNNRLVETILYERRTGTTRPAAFAQSHE